MTSWVALLRAVNVGGRSLLMSDLRAIAGELGLERARTHIATGNLLFSSDKNEAELKAMLEQRLERHLGSSVGVLLRSADALARVVATNPFTNAPGNKVVALFLDDPPPADCLDEGRNRSDERLALGKREIYVHYPSGMGRSKLRLPEFAIGTARNMNTVARLAELAREAQ